MVAWGKQEIGSLPTLPSFLPFPPPFSSFLFFINSRPTFWPPSSTSSYLSPHFLCSLFFYPFSAVLLTIAYFLFPFSSFCSCFLSYLLPSLSPLHPPFLFFTSLSFHSPLPRFCFVRWRNEIPIIRGCNFHKTMWDHTACWRAPTITTPTPQAPEATSAYVDWGINVPSVCVCMCDNNGNEFNSIFRTVCMDVDVTWCVYGKLGNLTHTCTHAHLRQKVQTGEMEGVRWATLLSFFSESFSLISVFSKDWAKLPGSSWTWETQIRNGIVKQSKESESVTLPEKSFSDVETKGWRKCHKMLVQNFRKVCMCHLLHAKQDKNVDIWLISGQKSSCT